MTRIYLSPPDVGDEERAAVMRAMEDGWIAPVGPELAAFESEIAAVTGWPGAVALSSGTAALHLALLAVGVGPGDRVAVSSFTFAATANAVVYCGAEPVFIDSEASSWNMSPLLLADALAAGRLEGRPISAVLVVDLYGQCADYDAISEVCQAFDVPIVEDAAEALGATYRGRAAGSLGAVGTFSFNGNKIMTTSGGGMLVAPDQTVAERARYLATQAREPAAHYEHTEVGFNYRLSNLLAALGRVQLRRLPVMSARRLAINERYRELLGGLCSMTFMPTPSWSGWNGWLTCVVFDRAELAADVRLALEAVDIESRPLWKPMHLQPAFGGAHAFVDGTSESLFHHGLCLPSGSVLSDADVEEVAAVVRATALVRTRP